MIWKYIFAFLVEKPAPLRRQKPHYQVGLKEEISLKKRLGGHLEFKKLAISLQRKQISGWSFFKRYLHFLALISYVIVILVGRTCLAVEQKMHMLISTFTIIFHFCTFCTDFFANVFYSALLNIVWEQIFYSQTILRRKCDWKRDMLRNRCFIMPFQGHPRSIGFI